MNLWIYQFEHGNQGVFNRLGKATNKIREIIGWSKNNIFVSANPMNREKILFIKSDGRRWAITKHKDDDSYLYLTVDSTWSITFDKNNRVAIKKPINQDVTKIS